MISVELGHFKFFFSFPKNRNMYWSLKISCTFRITLMVCVWVFVSIGRCVCACNREMKLYFESKPLLVCVCVFVYMILIVCFILEASKLAFAIFASFFPFLKQAGLYKNDINNIWIQRCFLKLGANFKKYPIMHFYSELLSFR